MKEVRAKQGQVLVLGRRGEHLARCITFDMAGWQETYGAGAVQLLAQRCEDEEPYPCDVTIQGDMARWAVTEVDVAMPGDGRLELQYRVGDTVVKSEIYRTLTMEALGNVGPVPSAPEKNWLDTVLQAASDAQQSAQAAKEAVIRTITIGENGNWCIDGKDTGVSASGPRGERGESGYPAMMHLSGTTQSLALGNNTDYRCTDAVTALTVTDFEADPNGRREGWSIQFVAGTTILVMLPDSVVWNYGATPVFTPGSAYWLLFTPLLNGKVLGVWNEVEA